MFRCTIILHDEVTSPLFSSYFRDHQNIDYKGVKTQKCLSLRLVDILPSSGLSGYLAFGDFPSEIRTNKQKLVSRNEEGALFFGL